MVNIFKEKHFGYLRQFDVPAVPASSKEQLGLDEDDMKRIGWANVIDVVNSGSEDVAIFLNGNPDHKLIIPGNLNKAMDGTRFTSVIIENLDGVSALTAGAVSIVIQKDFLLRDLADVLLRGMRAELR